jgi:hypothetical protein
MRSRFLKILSFVLIAMIYLAIAQIFGNRRNKKNYEIFNNSEIAGQIEQIGIKNRGVGFKIINDQTEYVFYPRISSFNQNIIFDHFAMKGDSIVKHRFQDILILIKKGKLYSYTFQKFK